MRQNSTILIVDDEQVGRDTLEALLTGQDYNLAFASDGAEALAKAAELTPDLVLLDVMMPGMDGFEVCQRLRADPLLAEVPIIIVTALDDRDFRLRGIEAGADDFVSKPFDRVELRARVRTVTRLNRYRQLLLANQQLDSKNAELRQTIQALQTEITERKRAGEALEKAYAKLKEMQQQLIQSEKLAALGRLSSDIAHEVKNPLAIILSGMEFLEIKLPNANTDAKTAMEKIKKATLRANDVLKNLLKFGRPSELKLERVKPDDLINNALSFFKYRALLRNIEIETQFPEEEIYVEVDKLQIQQVIFNLLMNSVEAMPDGGEIKIKTYKTALSEEQPCCVIEIADEGEGISEDDLSKLFEPFFTTKRDSKGTGLGLAISKMILDNHEGDLIIDSELGKGTDARVILPLA